MRQDTASTQQTNECIEPVAYVVSVVQGDRTVLLNAQSGRYYSLNAVGGDIWSALCARTPWVSIVASLASKYDTPFDTIDRDGRILINRLQEAGLAQRAVDTDRSE
jgi:hypothetical protein